MDGHDGGMEARRAAEVGEKIRQAIDRLVDTAAVFAPASPSECPLRQTPELTLAAACSIQANGLDDCGDPDAFPATCPLLKRSQIIIGLDPGSEQFSTLLLQGGAGPGSPAAR